MIRLSSYRAHCALSAAALLFCALTEPVSADTVMHITGNRAPTAQHREENKQAVVETPPSSAGGKTFIRIIGDKQTTSPKPARKQAVRPEAAQSASAVEGGGEVAEKAEQDRLAEIKGAQEEEAALQAAITRLEAAKAALIENPRLEAETASTQKKTTPSKQAGRKHKGAKKRHRKCLKYSTR
ncbi:MAG: hypothetical protein PHP95_08795 [Desulfuromonadaceae bacterium]|nr:hypothetical protein [Desulfuromonadaceae bacterium]MDD2848539.1 hypothetical protein [Desulfuromonadaceae bacterium]MDD4131559.1 hypothetical protein [Desulfuromonadaceae bacterium]